MPHKRRWTTNIRRVEIEISTFCNLTCPNCDRSVHQAYSTENMAIEQLEHFVEESRELEWDWERVSLLGGEPTLHPRFGDVLEVMAGYHRTRPGTEFRIFSNGFGGRVNAELARIPEWMTVFNTRKTREPPLFSTYNVAPVDLPGYAGEDFTKGCLITQSCGLGLTRYGYYPCGAGAGLDRVFGFDIGIKRLADVTPERLTAQLRRLCGLCGHFVDFDAHAEYAKQKDPNLLAGWTTEQRTSPRWASAYQQYRQSPPQLSLY